MQTQLCLLPKNPTRKDFNSIYSRVFIPNQTFENLIANWLYFLKTQLSVTDTSDKLPFLYLYTDASTEHIGINFSFEDDIRDHQFTWEGQKILRQLKDLQIPIIVELPPHIQCSESTHDLFHPDSIIRELWAIWAAISIFCYLPSLKNLICSHRLVISSDNSGVFWYLLRQHAKSETAKLLVFEIINLCEFFNIKWEPQWRSRWHPSILPSDFTSKILQTNVTNLFRQTFSREFDTNIPQYKPFSPLSLFNIPPFFDDSNINWHTPVFILFSMYSTSTDVTYIWKLLKHREAFGVIIAPNIPSTNPSLSQLNSKFIIFEKSYKLIPAYFISAKLNNGPHPGKSVLVSQFNFCCSEPDAHQDDWRASKKACGSEQSPMDRDDHRGPYGVEEHRHRSRHG